MMSEPPDNPKIYHITHVDNLSSIVADGCIWSDVQRLDQGLSAELVGLTNIKQVRLTKPVPCRPGTTVGQYAPFYLCPRSVMLYILYRGTYPGLTYREGQRPIVHVEADMRAAVAWARQMGRAWAFTDMNARSGYAKFFEDLGELDKIDWEAVHSHDFRDSIVQDHKQAEFLMHESFPWELIEHIGVVNSRMKTQAEEAIESADHKPLVNVEPNWYY